MRTERTSPRLDSQMAQEQVDTRPDGPLPCPQAAGDVHSLEGGAGGC